MIRNYLYGIVMSIMLVGCVPAKRYYELESENKRVSEQYLKDSTELVAARKTNGSLLMRLVAATQDSITLRCSYDSLQNELNNATIYGSQQLAKVQQQLDSKSQEATYKAKHSQQIMGAISTFDVEANTIYRRLDRTLQRYKSRGAKLTIKDWAVVITLPDQIVFESDNRENLTSSGKQIVASIASLVNQHPEFSMKIMEYSRPKRDKIMIDSLVHYTEKASYTHLIPAKDTLSTDELVEIKYDVERVRVEQVAQNRYTPAQLERGSAITSFLELTENRPISGIEYSGGVVTVRRLMPNQGADLDNSAQIVISPKLSVLLTMIKNL